MTQKKERNPFEVLRDLHIFAYGNPEQGDETEEQLDAALREYGVDPDRLVKSVQHRVELLLGQHRRAKANAVRTQLSDAIQTIFNKCKLPETALPELRRLQSQQPELFAANARKFKEATEQDAQALLKALFALEQIDEPNKDR